MGGDAFKDIHIEKVTNQEFKTLSVQILQLLSQICIKLQVYIPIPEKQQHGDIDFLVLLKQGIPRIHIPELLHSKKYIEGNNLNCQYKNKQIDFKFCENQDDYQLVYFFKAYGGIGAVTSYFLKQSNIKFSQKGLFINEHIHSSLKVSKLLTKKKNQILAFYGLDVQKFENGFCTKKQLFEYLITSRFFYMDLITKTQPKQPTKMYKQFVKYCTNNQIASNYKIKNEFSNDDINNIALQYFNAKEQFEKLLQSVKQQKKVQKEVKQKFNSNDILQHFNIPKTKLNEYKKKFRKHFKNQEQYQEFILQKSKQEIIKQFERIVLLQ